MGVAVAGGPDVTPSGEFRVSQGVGPMGRTYTFDIAPAASNTTTSQNEIALTQTTAGAANLTLTANGTTTTAGYDSAGNAIVILDCDRTVAFYSTGALNGVNFTVYGYDRYGQPLTNTIAGPNNSTVQTTKTFKSVKQIAVSGAVGTAVVGGLGLGIGLPFRVTDLGYVLNAMFNQTAITISSTAYKVADTTATATASTTDVRGYIVVSQTDGTKRLVSTFAIPALGSGPNATRIGAYGVTQF